MPPHVSTITRHDTHNSKPPLILSGFLDYCIVPVKMCVLIIELSVMSTMMPRNDLGEHEEQPGSVATSQKLHWTLIRTILIDHHAR